MKLRGKKGMTISIGFLVLLTLLLVGASLFLFVTEKSKINRTVNSVGFASQVAEREVLLNDYIQGVVNRAAKNTKTKDEFLTRFKDILDNDKIPTNIFIIGKDGLVYFPEYKQIIDQLKEENVELIKNGDKDIIKLKLSIEIKDQINGKLKDETEKSEFIDKFSFSYGYEKSFEAESSL
ncbi:MAG: hypothetical protein AABX03_01375 [Nanoarchaeota archaeon]